MCTEWNDRAIKEVKPSERMDGSNEALSIVRVVGTTYASGIQLRSDIKKFASSSLRFGGENEWPMLAQVVMEEIAMIPCKETLSYDLVEVETHPYLRYGKTILLFLGNITETIQSGVVCMECKRSW